MNTLRYGSKCSEESGSIFRTFRVYITKFQKSWESGCIWDFKRTIRNWVYNKFNITFTPQKTLGKR